MSLSSSSRRLNGWKEIADHLHKGLRTAQRMEKLYGLPVHRIGKGQGENVHAYVDEIDQWLKDAAARTAADRFAGVPDTADDPDDCPAERAAESPAMAAEPAQPVLIALPPPARSRPWWLPTGRQACIAAGLLALGVFIGWELRLADDAIEQRAASDPHLQQPVSFTVNGNALAVHDGRGAVLFVHHFPFRLREWAYDSVRLTAGDATDAIRLATFRDLDGDGTPEMLFVAIDSTTPERAPLYVFERDGRVRFSYSYSGRVTFGRTPFAGPFRVAGIRTVREADGTRSVWAVSHHSTLFPSVLQKLDAQGRPRSEYWSNGYITSVTTGLWQGQHVVLVGSVNNEHRSAALAVLDATRPSGSAPAGADQYKCTDCPAGTPTSFVVFPRSPRYAPLGGGATVGRVVFEESSRLQVSVVHAVDSGTEPAEAVAFYFLDGQLRPVAVDVNDSWSLVHDHFVGKGQLSKEPPVPPEQELLPILHWNGSGCVRVGLVPARPTG